MILHRVGISIQGRYLEKKLTTKKAYNKIASVKVFDILNSTLIWIHPNSIKQLRAVRELIAPVHNPWVA